MKLHEKIKWFNKSKTYHLVIFLSAALVLLVGGLLRGARQDEKTMRFEISTLEALRKEVEGVQTVLKKSELESIAQTGDQFNILFDDGTQELADLVAFDQAEHLAVLRLRAPKVHIRLAEFEEKPLPQAGAWLVRLARSPMGQRSVSLGMISVIRRDTSGFETFLLDSAVARERDGCPALNLEGRITGINIWTINRMRLSSY
jgi:hypothetical protein